MRADVFLVRGGHAPSREAARKSIEAGLVRIDGIPVKKPSEAVDEDASHTVECTSVIPYVSRGGLKLAHALDTFSIDVNHLSAADIGASTGGFTDCLLRRGAARVCSIDSGHGQLAPSLLADERVISIEGKNARTLCAEDLPFTPDIVVMDVSFISQTLILPCISAILPEHGIAVTLIKPQFEAGKAALGKGGIVKSAADRKFAVRRVISAGAECGLYASHICDSPIEGGDGNREYLIMFRKKHDILPPKEPESLKY